MNKLLIAIAALLLTTSAQAQAKDYSKYYENLPTKVAQVSAPVIPANVVSITEVGGVGDGITLNTDAFENAIKKLQKVGGGRLNVPEGIWLTGPIQLKDNIELHLEHNAIILMSPDKSLFVNPKSSTKCFAGIRASKRKNIAITGQGIIDGNGAHWRPVKRQKVSDVEWNKYKKVIGGVEKDGGKLWYPFNAKAGYANIADTPEQQEKMRNDLVRFESCENVLVEGVTIQNAPKFHLHPCFSKNVIIDGVTVRCPWNAQNGDAIDFSDVNIGLIVNCTVDAGDDGLCMKSGNNKPEAPANGCEDILIQDNTVFHAHGGFVLGSETIQGMRRIVVRHCRFSGTDTGLRFKSGLGRGGKTEQMFIQNIVMNDIKDEAIVFQCDYLDRPAGSDPNAIPTFTAEQKKVAPYFQDIHISNVVCYGAGTAIKASGILGLDNVKDIDITGSTIKYYVQDQQIDEKTAKLKLTNVRLVPEKQ
ncbi:MAG: glycoside hydrolase family 28 protein [Prevotella sp.]|nr:glycoside hydrolase family 28 protein [Prevotella sp.]